MTKQSKYVSMKRNDRTYLQEQSYAELAWNRHCTVSLTSKPLDRITKIIAFESNLNTRSNLPNHIVAGATTPNFTVGTASSLFAAAILLNLSAVVGTF